MTAFWESRPPVMHGLFSCQNSSANTHRSVNIESCLCCLLQYLWGWKYKNNCTRPHIVRKRLLLTLTDPQLFQFFFFLNRVSVRRPSPIYCLKSRLLNLVKPIPSGINKSEVEKNNKNKFITKLQFEQNQLSLCDGCQCFSCVIV